MSKAQRYDVTIRLSLRGRAQIKLLDISPDEVHEYVEAMSLAAVKAAIEDTFEPCEVVDWDTTQKNPHMEDAP